MPCFVVSTQTSCKISEKLEQSDWLHKKKPDLKIQKKKQNKGQPFIKQSEKSGTSVFGVLMSLSCSSRVPICTRPWLYSQPWSRAMNTNWIYRVNTKRITLMSQQPQKNSLSQYRDNQKNRQTRHLLFVDNLPVLIALTNNSLENIVKSQLVQTPIFDSLGFTYRSMSDQGY